MKPKNQKRSCKYLQKRLSATYAKKNLENHRSEFIAQLCCALVIFGFDRRFKLAAQFLFLGKRAIGLHAFAPFFEKMNFAALLDHIIAPMIAQKFFDVFNAFADDIERVVESAVFDFDTGAGARLHHHHIRPELFQRHTVVFVLRVFAQKIEGD